MPQRVLILQSDGTTAKTLARFFTERGDQVWQTAQAEKAISFLEKDHPDLVMVDLHMPGNDWLTFLRQLRKVSPATGIIITNKYPDFQRELLAKEQGARVFLRQPFTNQWIEAALHRLTDEPAPESSRMDPRFKQPKVRFPVRIKITLPYVVLAMLFALAGAYVVSQMVMESMEDRFNNQLVETGIQTSDWMVQEESRLLETLRLVANTQGMAAAAQGGDAESLRQIVLPLAVNARVEAVEILDKQGVGVLSLRHVPGGNIEEYSSARGDTVFGEWDFVQYVLQGRKDQGLDKSAGLAHPTWGDTFYVSGPLFDPSGAQVGVILVGKSLVTMVREMREDTLAETTVYDLAGSPLASTVPGISAQDYALAADLATGVLAGQDEGSHTRDIQVASNLYREILGPWEARGGKDLGVVGVSLAQLFLVRTSQITRAQVFVLVSIAFLLVITVGVFLANQITRPLLRVVRASTEIAHGNLEVKVDSGGNDEVAVLAHSFNYMVAGLQEGSIYRDLLGRTVSPEVREQLRQTFTLGNVRLEGQEAVSTVLITDVRGFTSLSEKVDPATVFNWLNEYFSELVPVITANNGVVNKFDGDAMLAFFGILPRPLSPKQSAYFACRAAVEMLEVIERLNIRRVERGEPPLATGIGINTGVVTAGGLGTSDRLHYTIIGDTVNTAQRVEALTRELFNVSAAIITHSTYSALAGRQNDFRIEDQGAYGVKGKSERLLVYRLLPGLAVPAAEVEEMTV
jgi:adenylate cyclase